MKKLFVAMLLFTVVFVGDAQVVKATSGGSSPRGEEGTVVEVTRQAAQAVAKAAGKPVLSLFKKIGGFLGGLLAPPALAAYGWFLRWFLVG